MSTTETRPAPEACGADASEGPCLDLLPGRRVPLSPRESGPTTEVTRLLPQRGRRTVGAWCFVDHYGPDDVSTGEGMQVPPHPHTGLQTASWLLDGSVRHRDSLGHDVVLTPGVLGLMTAGRGIAHSERSPDDRPPVLHGLQLWVALPAEARAGDPAFALHADLPTVDLGGGTARVLVGSLGGRTSDARSCSPLLGAELRVRADETAALELDPLHEHAIVVAQGSLRVDGEVVEPGTLAYLGTGREHLALRAGDDGTVALLLGGEPFAEELLMWWNFLGRDQAEVERARADWNDETAAASTFGTVDDEGRLVAPPLPGVALRPRGRTG